MSLTPVEVIANRLADMPDQILPVYTMQFPSDVANCIAIFPAGGGEPVATTASDGTDYMDYPGVQIQVRYTNPHDAYVLAEAIRVWLDDNLDVTDYLRCDTNRSAPDDLTNSADLGMNLGPCYRFSVDFTMIKIRA